ncbi:GNAT family N-acetyltransferase [Halobacillus litoralis]|uniref:GNAT family N-acetyltransferase n=1 Tax=Halobacillus litoralis TaxID=45668 RepID=A0A845F7C2_9BACI|nr:GNAT family N-acetyltransferase [Halobacillus litoralis]MYL69605.1 GNAT family N-acetyltransferase [Halobacillus litoralis]
MTIMYEHDPGKFLERVEPLLLAKEAENNLPLGILDRLKNSQGKEACHLISFQENGKPAFMSMRTPPHLWIIPSIDHWEPDHIVTFVRYLLKEGHEVPGVLGERKAVEFFIREWKRLTGQEAELQMEQGIFRLDQLKMIRRQRGHLIEADASHQFLVEKWLEQYGKETGEAHVGGRAKELAESLIEDQRLHLWIVDGEAVSMASRARTTKNGATINAVFTPDQYKRNGYASQAVWHLTDRLLKSGYSFCSLYTDLANSTSNSIYKKIGYERIGDSIVYNFTK